MRSDYGTRLSHYLRQDYGLFRVSDDGVLVDFAGLAGVENVPPAIGKSIANLRVTRNELATVPGSWIGPWQTAQKGE